MTRILTLLLNCVTNNPGYRMKNKTMAGSTTELVAEVKLDETGMATLEELRGKSSVKEISVMDSLAGSVL